jgi:hypothetical protein
MHHDAASAVSTNPRGPIRSEVASLAAHAQRLQEAVDSLTQALGPILLPSKVLPTPNGEPESEPFVCEHYSELCIISGLLTATIRGLDSLRDRIAL